MCAFFAYIPIQLILLNRRNAYVDMHYGVLF